MSWLEVVFRPFSRLRDGAPGATVETEANAAGELYVAQGAKGAEPWPSTDEFSEFWRIKSRRFADAEEVRYDIPVALASSSIYTGVAADSALTSDAVWTIIRTQFDGNGNPNRERIRFAMTWDGRAAGWP